MTRRRLFAVLFAPLVARFLPKPKPKPKQATLFEENLTRALLHEGEIINELLDALYSMDLYSMDLLVQDLNIPNAQKYADRQSHPAYFGEAIGDTISIRRPVYFTGRRGETEKDFDFLTGKQWESRCRS